ncbi:MAG: TonB-dependent receptor [Betaproteobacteria bacterium]|nr:TonB-dependent receptor [Betaproteobacteria bacterium]
MKRTSSLRPIAAAVSLLFVGMTMSPSVLAQSPAPAAPATTDAAKKAEDEKKAAEGRKKAPEPERIIVTGIRASLERSIETKKDADTNVEVVSAEDVGKMPDKNIADALSRLTGVNVQYGGALAMDEAERVAIRGTSPNLNLVTVNGHALSSGDWHVGDQGSSGRSVGFGLMPSQLIGQSIVYKTGRADITEGGIAGTVDVIFRKPLKDFRKPLTTEVSLGLVHADLPKKTDPQASGLIAWQNADKTLGVMLQAYKEDRHLRRDGQETFGFNYLSVAQANASGDAALIAAAQAAASTSTPTQTDVRMPGSLNSALFEGVRERTGGYVGVQWRPTSTLDLSLSAFRTELKADNYNSSGFALPNTLLANGWQIQNPVVRDNVLVSASLVRPSTASPTQRVIGFQFDHNLRQGAKSLSEFVDLEGKWDVTSNLSIKGRLGNTEGSGVTNSQPSLTFGLINPNVRYTINGGGPTDYVITNSATGQPIDLSNPANYVQMSNTGASVVSKDKEDYLHLDGQYEFDKGLFTRVKFGLRTAEHKRTYDVLGARWNAQDLPSGLPVSPSPFISVTGGLLVTNIVGNNYPTPATSYPGNWAQGLSGNFPRNLFRFSPDQLQAFANQYVNWDPVRNKIWTSGYEVIEKNEAVYLMGEFEAANNLSGNVGLRAVTTKVRSTAYQALPAGTGVGQCTALAACSIPGAIVGSAFATYLPQVVETKHTDWLPSLNLRWEIEPKLIARLGLTRTLGRANYNELAGAVSLNNTLLTGSSGNPYLKPTMANNIDVSLAYYFAKRAYVSGAVFQQNIRDYVKPGASNVEFFNTATGLNATYLVTSRIQTDAKVRGFEVAGELPIGAGFGVLANATYVDAKDKEGLPFLGTSRLTYNLSGYYEDDKLSARLAWNWRSDYAIGLLNNKPGVITAVGTHRYDDGGSLSASVSYKIAPNISVHLDGNNLLNPVRNTYYINSSAPGYWHESGRQYFLTLRAKF